MESILEPYDNGKLHLKNRILKSGIYEGRCNPHGFPLQSYIDYYKTFAMNGVGGLITGFAYISPEGRAMQPLQAGIDHPDKVPYYQKVTKAVHSQGCPIFLQIAHAGRQTLKRITRSAIRGSSSKRSAYFRGRPIPLLNGEVYLKIREFADAASLAKESGFDGIQLHAAHGYLIHQFLLSAINDRRDEFGIDKNTGIGSAFLEQVSGSVFTLQPLHDQIATGFLGGHQRAIADVRRGAEEEFLAVVETIAVWIVGAQALAGIRDLRGP